MELADLRVPTVERAMHGPEPRLFNGLLSTHLGPVKDENSNTSCAPRLPGASSSTTTMWPLRLEKAAVRNHPDRQDFRNEITRATSSSEPGSLNRWRWSSSSNPVVTREWHEYWLKARWDWYVDLGLNPDNMRFFEHPKEKLSHYSKRTVDIEYRFQFGGSEFGEF